MGGAQGIRALEIDVTVGSHLDATTVDDAALEQLPAAARAHITSDFQPGLLRSAHRRPGGTGSAKSQADAGAAIELAARLSVGTVCTLAGFPAAGKNSAKTIAEDLPAVMRPVLDLAGRHGVGWRWRTGIATNIQHLDHWRGVFDVLPDAHFGLNFDPIAPGLAGHRHIAAVY